MRVFTTLTRRELAAYFLSFSGYVIIAAAAVLMGSCLVTLIDMLTMQTVPMPLNELFFGTWYPWLVLIPVAPLISMRVFALEKSSGFAQVGGLRYANGLAVEKGSRLSRTD